MQVFLDEGRRLLDFHWRRGDAFERKSLGVLAFTSVVVALLITNIKIVLELPGHYRTVGLVIGAAALAALTLSAAAAAGALRARDTKSVNIADVRKSWQMYLDRTERGDGYSDAWHTAGLKRELAEMLLHGRADSQSPVQSMRADADCRGRWFVWAIWLNLVSLLLILALTVTTTVGTLSMTNDPRPTQQPDPAPKMPAQPQPQTEKKGGELGGGERRG
ncbi:hypothetical protein [Actinomadura sp. 7K534]|uniref:hypothetical protein n=1 Tax=Actinomadura sp. 7K534 TaxID=2530366 RepID=UPI00104C6790|nr:hypothetical protein [Actinomadura sp. 7K534]TDB89797.1 hypothetical protein E1266_29100 [Actinomadura sp. 7K534]